MKINDLLIGNTAQPRSLPETEIYKCSSNYMEADENTLLFLLPGVSFDTYELIPKYLKSGAAAIVTENAKRFHTNDTRIVEVKNARLAFSYALSRLCGIDYEKLKIIGITGTNGKTSTATMIKRIIEREGIKCGFIGTGKIEFMNRILTKKDYSMTSPDPDILYPAIKSMETMGCEVLVMEASSHALELDKLAPIPFDIGIFTGLSHEHLEFHGSMEKYFYAKEKLIKASKTAIINFDDSYGKRLYEKYKEKATGIGVVWQSDVSATDVENFGLSGIGYIYRGKNLLTKIKLPLPGLYNIYNSMMAFECAYKMNISVKNIKLALECIDKIDGRCECIEDEVTVVIDYAHTPEALRNILKTVNYSKNIGQKTTILFGCGGERDYEKRPIMAQIAEDLADKVIVTNDNPRNEDEQKIIKEILSGFKKDNHGVITNRENAIRYAIENAKEGDIIIVAGKGHEKYIIDRNGYHDFDEKEIILSAIKSRKAKRCYENKNGS